MRRLQLLSSRRILLTERSETLELLRRRPASAFRVRTHIITSLPWRARLATESRPDRSLPRHHRPSRRPCSHFRSTRRPGLDRRRSPVLRPMVGLALSRPLLFQPLLLLLHRNRTVVAKAVNLKFMAPTALSAPELSIAIIARKETWLLHKSHVIMIR